MDIVRSADGTEIAFERSREGPPLVLVGGAFQDRSSMKTLGIGLRDSFTIYAYDRRGRGNSGNTPPYAVEREVEDLAVVVEAAGGRPFVFGQSSGGALALEAAARGVPIRALVVNEPPFTDGPSTEVAESLEKLVADGEQGDAVAAFLELSGTPPAIVAEMRAAPHWPRMQAFAPTLSHEIRLCNNGIVPTDRLAHVSARTLVLAGAESPAWARQAAGAIADAVPTGEARVLEGQHHIIVDDVLIPVLKELFV